MLQVYTRSAEIQIRNRTELEAFIAPLIKLGFKPVSQSLLEAVRSIPGIPDSFEVNIKDIFPDDGMVYRVGPHYRRNQEGDILFSENTIITLIPSDSRLVIKEITKNMGDSKIDEYCLAMTKSAKAKIDGRRLRSMKFEWQGVSPTDLNSLVSNRMSRRLGVGRRSQKISHESPLLDEKSASCADILSDKRKREILREVSKVRKARIGDVSTEDNELIIDELVAADLLRKEYLIECKKDSHTIISADDLESVRKLQSSGKCPDCSRRLSEEKITEILAISDAGKSLMDSSKWMEIWISKMIVDMGVPAEDIFCGVTIGSDEIDIIFKTGGNMVFMELKDREFGLGDAYPFSLRVNRYGAHEGVIVTMDSVGEEVNKFLVEQRRGESISISCLEGDEIASKLREKIERLKVYEAVQAASRSGLNLRMNPLIAAWAAK